MGWDDGNKKGNPWRGSDGNKGQPDLDAIVKDFQRRLSRLFGGGSGGSGQSGDGPNLNPRWIIAGIVVLAVLWALSGFYQVGAAERGVVLRFGQYEETTSSGLQWHLPWPIEKVIKVNTDAIQTWDYQGHMLTQDENIVDVNLIVQYRRANPVKYLFSVRQPEATLHAVTRSAIREVIGKNKLDFILTDGRKEIARKTEALIQSTMNEYDSGIKIYELNLQDANFPDPVESAVQDAVKAREDKERSILEAQKYANAQIPRAKGDAARTKQTAEAYRDKVVAKARGNTARFLQILKQYEQAPEVTRRRMYLDTIQEVMANSTKVLLTTEGSGNLLYIPLDKLIENSQNKPANAAKPSVSSIPSASSPTPKVSLRQRASR